MTQNDDQRITASLVKIMAMSCVRNSRLEDLHAGQVPVTHTGDYSDVFVVDADGRQIPWPDVSRFNDAELRAAAAFLNVVLAAVRGSPPAAGVRVDTAWAGSAGE